MERELAISTRRLNRLLRGVLWGLHLDAEAAGGLVSGSDVLRLAIRDGDPRLRVYYVVRGPDTCELCWLEIDPAWRAENPPFVT